MVQPWEQTPEDVFEERADDPGQALCPTCLEPTRWNANFCHTCLCPLTWYAGTGPLERVWAWPWIVWRTGRTAWPRPIHAWGTTVVLMGSALAPLVPLLLAVLGDGMGPGAAQEQPWGALEVLIWVVMSTLLGASGLILILRAWVNYLDRKDVDPWPTETPTSE